jgi:hypothetical protein
MSKLRFFVFLFLMALPKPASSAGLDGFCPDVRAVFQMITAKMSGKDAHEAYINNATALVKKPDLRVALQTECPKMSKGVETIAKKKPSLGSDLWKESVLNILTP